MEALLFDDLSEEQRKIIMEALKEFIDAGIIIMPVCETTYAPEYISHKLQVNYGFEEVLSSN
jgi:TRAP-type C4-dicarboxylate transport system substrate-binding protein